MSEVKRIRPEVIFLEPECCACPETGAQWCQDDVFDQCEDGVRATRYVRGDIHDEVAARLRAAEAERDKLREALAWYAEMAAGCRKLGSLGNPARHALDADGGKCARDALGQVPTP